MHLYAYFSCSNCTIQTKNTWKQLEFVAFNFKCKLLVLKSCNMYFKVTQYKYLVLAQYYLRTRYEKLVNNSIQRGLNRCKCFTCFTKTFANLTTYSRKPGDYNGTIIFEIDIMKNSSPLNLKFSFFANVKTKIILLFCWIHHTLSSASE